MLKNMLYLDVDATNSYLGSLERGLRDKTEWKDTKAKKKGAKLGVSGTHAELAGSSESSSSITLTDNDQSRYDRFEELLEQNGPNIGWIEASSSEDLDSARVNSFLKMEADIVIPQYVRALSRLDEFAQVARIAGVDTEKHISSENTSVIAKLVGNDLAVKGEVLCDTSWSVAGKVKDSHLLTDDIDGVCTIVGRVTKIIREGDSSSLLTLPGMNFLNREQRRELERKSFPTQFNDALVQGPAIILNIIAIYQ